MSRTHCIKCMYMWKYCNRIIFWHMTKTYKTNHPMVVGIIPLCYISIICLLWTPSIIVYDMSCCIKSSYTFVRFCFNHTLCTWQAWTSQWKFKTNFIKVEREKCLSFSYIFLLFIYLFIYNKQVKWQCGLVISFGEDFVRKYFFSSFW